ncbi:MAG: methyltransferase domain-containing protein [Acidimicrobiales bacterium]
MNQEGYSRVLEEAETHARLGLPIPKGVRHRLLKRVIAKLCWFFLHHQVALNKEVLAALETLILSETGRGAQLEAQGTRLEAQGTRLEAQGTRLEAQGAQLEAQGAQLEALGAQLEALGADLWAAITTHTSQLEALGDLWAAITTHSSQLDALSADLWAAITAHTSKLEALGDLWAAVTAHTGQLEALGDLWAAITAHTSQLDALSAELWAAITAHTSQLEALGDLWAAITTHTSQLEALGDLWTAITTHSSQLDALGADLWAAITAHTSQLEALGDLWAAVTAHTGQLEALGDPWAAITAHSSQLEALGDPWAAITTHTSQIEALGDPWAAIVEGRELLEQQQIALKLQVDLVQRQAFARHHEGIGDLRTELAEMGLLIGEFHKKLDTAAAELRIRQGAVDLLLDEVRRSLPEPPSPQALEKLPRAMDTMYADFEEVFRGPSVHVTEVVKEYLPDILALDRHGPVVDLGSGRGEWLELLKDAGVDAYGVDPNQEFVEQCQARGLKVVLADACEHLAGVSERSLSALTAFHLVENVPVDRVIKLIDLSVRALQPGGLLILETANPDNLVVGASSFYVDPSHVRPLPPRLLAFLVEARGFADVETRFLHPNAAGNLPSPRDTEPWSGDLAPLVEAINARLYGPQDYAVIGRRL